MRGPAAPQASRPRRAPHLADALDGCTTHRSSCWSPRAHRGLEAAALLRVDVRAAPSAREGSTGGAAAARGGRRTSERSKARACRAPLRPQPHASLHRRLLARRDAVAASTSLCAQREWPGGSTRRAHPSPRALWCQLDTGGQISRWCHRHRAAAGLDGTPCACRRYLCRYVRNAGARLRVRSRNAQHGAKAGLPAWRRLAASESSPRAAVAKRRAALTELSGRWRGAAPLWRLLARRPRFAGASWRGPARIAPSDAKRGVLAGAECTRPSGVLLARHATEDSRRSWRHGARLGAFSLYFEGLERQSKPRLRGRTRQMAPRARVLIVLAPLAGTAPCRAAPK